jgi:hypothetical protein
MSAKYDELNQIYKDLYAEQTTQLNAHRKERDELLEKHKAETKALNDKHKEDRKPISEKINEASANMSKRGKLETEIKTIYNSLISGLANNEYDSKKVMEQAEKEAADLLI